MRSTVLSSAEYVAEAAKAKRLFGNRVTRFGVPVVERNRQLVQTLYRFSHELPREITFAATYYQLPPEHLAKLPKGVKRLVQQANGLSLLSREQPELYLNALTNGKFKPAAFLINAASAIHALSDEKTPLDEKRRIGQLVLDLHAPLMGTLGLHWVQHEIGNLGVKYGYPEEYALLVKKLKHAEGQFEKHVLPPMREGIREAAEELGVHYEFTHRVKQPYSAYAKRAFKRAKRQLKGKDSDLPDKVAMRVVLHGSEKNCYDLLEKLKRHEDFKVRLDDDYIANPKPNGYKSLHVSVRRNGSPWFELQIRTHEMHAKAESSDPGQIHWLHKLRYFPSPAVDAIREVARHSNALLGENGGGQ
ncbi:MAG: hypothetical protein Q8R15_00300 [Candidatus Micrarchaeota archaeon]|nr:hypothetical protein [Candidatus Micrarchaeota archaeon]